jgi:hypothetical protein
VAGWLDGCWLAGMCHYQMYERQSMLHSLWLLSYA